MLFIFTDHDLKRLEQHPQHKGHPMPLCTWVSTEKQVCGYWREFLLPDTPGKTPALVTSLLTRYLRDLGQALPNT